MSDKFIHHVHVMETHPCFEGHFPTFPVFPAVAQLSLLIEAAEAYHKKECELIALPVSKFLNPVRATTVLTIELLKKEGNRMNFIILETQKVIAKGTFIYRIITS